MNQKKLVAVLLFVVLLAVGAAIWFASRPEAADEPIEKVEPAATGTVGEAPASRKRVPSAAARTRWTRVGPGTVVGFVRVYGTEQPVEGVEVTLEAGLPGPNEVLSARTDADGAFVFPAVTNFESWTFRAKAPSPLADAEIGGIDVLENRERDMGTVYLAPAFGVPGEVVDEKGTPIAGASVRAIKTRSGGNAMDILRLIRELPTRSPAVDSAVSGADGKFELHKVSPGRYEFTAEKAGYQIKVEPGVVITPDAKSRPLRFVLARGFQLAGKVVREGGGPVAGLPVVAFLQPRNEMAFNVLDKSFATTDEKGAFLLDGLGGGRYVVAVSPENEPSVANADVQVPAKEPIELLLKGDCSLEGRITGEGDLPVADAQVYAINLDQSPKVGNVKTDASGHYEIRGLSSGPLQLFLVQAEGYGNYPEDLSGLMRGRGSDVKLVPGKNEKNVSLAKGGVVRGVVKEKGTDVPIGGARVELGTPLAFFGGNRGATTSADGRFEITSVPKGTAILMVSKEGWFQPGINPQSVVMIMASRMQGGASPGKDTGKGATVVISEPGEVLERTLELAHGSSLSGIVTTPDGVPMPGAQVSVALEGDGNQFTRMAGGFFPMPEPRLTDAQGHYEMAGPPPGEKARVVARASGYLDGRSDVVNCGAGEAVANVGVKLRQGATLAGKVHDEAGRPIDGALVRWVQVTDENPWSLRWQLRNATPTVADAKGEFRIPNVETGKLAIQVSSTRHLSWSTNDVAAEDGKTATFDVTLKAGATLDGRVAGLDGRPKSGATVSYDRQGALPEGVDANQEDSGNVTSDAAGNFHVEGLIPGEYELVARAEGAAPSEPVRTATSGQPVTLQLAQAFTVSGVVRSKNGGGVAGVEVVLQKRAVTTDPSGGASDQVRDVESTRTGAAGEFELKDVPGGSYELSVRVGWGEQPRPNIVPVTLKDVQAGRQGLVVEVEPGLTITGIAIGEDGQPMSGGYVWANPEKPAPGVNVGVNDQIEEGRFELSGLVPGRYRITVVGPANQQKLVFAEAGAKDLRVEFGGGGSIKVRVLKEGAPVQGAWVWAQSEAGGGQGRTDADGRFEMKGLAEGTYTVSANQQTGGVLLHAQQEGVQVRSGGASDVELTVAKQP